MVLPAIPNPLESLGAQLEAAAGPLQAAVEQGFQFERLGYYCRDNKEEGLVFNQTVGLRDSWAKIEQA